MKTQWKKLFYEGKLVLSAKFEGLNLKLNLKTTYQVKEYYRYINKMLRILCNETPLLKEKFHLPSVSNQVPYLKLKENHGYLTAEQALDELRNFAKPKPRIKKTLTKPNKDDFILIINVKEGTVKRKAPASQSEEQKIATPKNPGETACANPPSIAPPSKQSPEKPNPIKHSTSFLDLNFKPEDIAWYDLGIRSKPSFEDLLYDGGLTSSTPLLFSTSPSLPAKEDKQHRIEKSKTELKQRLT